jgi:hypothetical protein
MYNAFVKSKYESKGETKTRFKDVGVAFDAKDGGFDLIIDDNINVGGKIHVRPRKAKGSGEQQAGDTGDDFLE